MRGTPRPVAKEGPGPQLRLARYLRRVPLTACLSVTPAAHFGDLILIVAELDKNASYAADGDD